MRQHEVFILTPIEKLLGEAALATACLESGMSTYPIFDYVIQSLFLKMTGFQEQKLKCITWELATDDYEYRYEKFGHGYIGECSTLKDKNAVFNGLIKQINKKKVDYSKIDDNERKRIVADSIDVLDDFLENSRLKGWAGRQYVEYKKLVKVWSETCFYSTHNDLLGHCENCRLKSSAPDGSSCKYGTMSDLYTVIYQQRNRCAHNTTSYLQNLPVLDFIDRDIYSFENYFLHFAVLIIIDKIFITLFKRYLELYTHFSL